MPASSGPLYPPSHSQNSVEFFRNANNPAIHGNSFHIDQSTNLFTQKDGFQALQAHVAPAAFHNSKQRVDPPRCHPHTREAVLVELFDWIVGNVPRETWIAWLNGAAGAGKSAICQSIAERCIQHGILVASFFFFRTDSTRNTIDPLVATLAYQIIQLLPQTKDHIVHAIESNPLIFEQTFEDQLDVLIVRPLQFIRIYNPGLNIVIIIDGVDECKGGKAQTSLIRTIEQLLRFRDVPFKVLFGSRRENQILMAFNARNMDSISTQIPLDDNYKPEEDILRFLNERFDEIKQTHPFSGSLRADWPSPSHVQEIVHKSSGQFIYASVVINFLSDPFCSPSARLEIIRGLRPTGRLTPFAQLDAIYCYIFLQVDDIPAALDILAYFLFMDDAYLEESMYFFELELADIQSILAPLASVLVCDPNGREVYFHHASLPDFLQDKARSGEYCINALGAPLCIRWFKAAESGRFRELKSWDRNHGIDELLDHAKVTDELYLWLILYSPLQNPSAFESEYFARNILHSIRNMDLGDGGIAFNIMLKTIVEHVKNHFPDTMSFIEESFDISHILDELDSEEEAEFSSGSGSDAESKDDQSDKEITSSKDPASDTDTSGLFTNIEEPVQSPVHAQFAQFDEAHEPGNVPTSIGCHGSTDVIRPSSPTAQTPSSRPQKRTREPTTINRPAKHARM